jgi:hypothetical protein
VQSYRTLRLSQLLTAARIYEKLRFPSEGRPSPAASLDRRAAILLTLPATFHCIFRLGFGTYDARAFLAKVLMVRTCGYPGWALPMARGVLFAILMVLGPTSAFLVVQHPRCEPMGYPTGAHKTFTRAGALHPAQQTERCWQP